MQIASEMAGFTMGEADTLRRAMGKKDRELMARQRDKFIAGCRERGIPDPTADRVWELMEKFAGYGFNKSHGAAYALVAYQTAYLKAHYPVEFMAALLTSEMGDTDKVVKYIEECRAMGIRVEPPDVNASQVSFTVSGNAIRFGLAAIKNVGEAAIASILAARGRTGPFRSLEDFCARVDLRLVNRRVLESLVKAGAFDSLGLPRAHLLATADAALEAGQRQQREQAEGQGSFFELLGTPPPARAEPSQVTPEWDSDQLLQFEKEVLGFYLSGHPLARFRPLADSLGVTGSGDLASRSAGSRVLLLGQVVGLKETATKSGSRMAFVTLEDMDGAVEVTVFPEAYRVAAEHLRSGRPLLIRGRVDNGDRGCVVLAEEVRPLDQALGPEPARASADPRALRLHVEAGEDAAALLAALRTLCARYPGPVPVFLHLRLPGYEVVIRSRAVAVDPSPELLEQLAGLLGPAGLAVDRAGHA